MSLSLPTRRPSLGLLSSFPTPPTHIPASPATSTPSSATFLSPLSSTQSTPRSPSSPGEQHAGHVLPTLGPPPTTPLPPIPMQPSPVTPEEQLAFIKMRRPPSYASISSHASSSSSVHSRRRRNRSDSPEHAASVNDDDDRAPTPQAANATTASTPSSVSPHTPSASERASSPDIKILIQRTSTPRLSRRARSFYTRRAGTASPNHPSSSALKRLRSTPALVEVGSFYPHTRPHAAPFWTTRSSTASVAGHQHDDDDDREFELDGGQVVATDTWDEVWDDPDDIIDEDSDEEVIDLRTPLPDLMLRAGLLSPHSKLLPRPLSSPKPPKPSDDPPAGSGRASPATSIHSASTHGTASTKTPLHPRDERDTERRRARHKDGRLLRGGIGLTTGLGWSDSEDEDAPSELTNRLSRLAPTLSRKSSAASSIMSTSSTASTPVPPPSPALSAAGRAVGGPFKNSHRGTLMTLRRTGSDASAVSSLSVTTTRESVASATALPYLEWNGGSEASSVFSVPVRQVMQQEEMSSNIAPEYPYEFPPPTPTEQGHFTSDIGEGAGAGTSVATSTLMVASTTKEERWVDDRSPTPTKAKVIVNTNIHANTTADLQHHQQARWIRPHSATGHHPPPVRKSSLPVPGGGYGTNGALVPGSPLSPPSPLSSVPSQQPGRPMSKMLPPIPVPDHRGITPTRIQSSTSTARPATAAASTTSWTGAASTTPASSSSSRPQSRASSTSSSSVVSGFPGKAKTASMTSLRSAGDGSSDSGNVSTPRPTTIPRRERAVSAASMQHQNAQQAVSNMRTPTTMKGGTAAGAPGSAIPRVASGSSPTISTSPSSFPTATSSSASVVPASMAVTSVNTSGMTPYVPLKTRQRRSSSSSNASSLASGTGRLPLKPAIKMTTAAGKRPRYSEASVVSSGSSSSSASSAGAAAAAVASSSSSSAGAAGVGVVVQQTGIAI